MCPACVGTHALPGAIACAAGNGARRCRFLPHKQVGIRRSIWRTALARDRFNRYRRQQARGDERRAQIVNFSAVIQVAGLETPQYRDMVGVKSLGAFGQQLPEIAACARVHRQAIVANAPVAIQQYVPLANLCKRIAILGQLDRDIRFGRQDDVCDNRVAAFGNKTAADKIRRLNGRRGKGDLPEIITPPGHNRQDDVQGLAFDDRRLNRDTHISVKKALTI